jgi:hypothetical protein
MQIAPGKPRVAGTGWLIECVWKLLTIEVSGCHPIQVIVRASSRVTSRLVV